MPTERYRTLSRRISELRRSLLPRRFDPTGSYRNPVYDRTRAFRVLTHAEFEHFIEERALEVLNTSYAAWRQKKEISHSLLSLLAYRENGHSEPTSLLNPPQKRSPGLDGRIEAAKDDLNRYIRSQNHGIKERNLLRILLPLGVDESSIDVNWLSAIDTWATQRGETAHKTGKVQVRPDPEHEYKTVRMILEGFRDLDTILSRI